MHEQSLDRNTVLDLLDETVHTLQRDDEASRTGTCEQLGIPRSEWGACRDAMVEELLQAEDWVEREEALVREVDRETPIDSEEGPEFLPSHQTLALFQSAMDEQLDMNEGRLFQPGDPRWLSVLYHRLRSRLRGKAPFVAHEALEDFRFALPERGRVVLVSDWGTGNVHAVAIAREIAGRAPDHVIHLGDVYYSGTRREVRSQFLDVWRAHGPSAARYWALNSNHEMYSGGRGYFGITLPAFGQPASYFSLRNRHWQLVGLDTGYVNHTLNPPQVAWLAGQLDSSRTILLTHHHLVSPFRKPGRHMEELLDPFISAGRIYGWFWGHEHHLIEFADHRGMKCRCIGHGSLPYAIPTRRRVRYDVPVARLEGRPSPRNPSLGMHGFALLTFDGPRLAVEYIDEVGGLAWSERWE
jgi:hypothetical protein